jgi:hypothetical protein
MDDDPVHTADTHYFCTVDPSCPCHEDDELIADLAALVEAGEVTAEEATALASGKGR